MGHVCRAPFDTDAASGSVSDRVLFCMNGCLLMTVPDSRTMGRTGQKPIVPRSYNAVFSIAAADNDTSNMKALTG